VEETSAMFSEMEEEIHKDSKLLDLYRTNVVFHNSVHMLETDGSPKAIAELLGRLSRAIWKCLNGGGRAGPTAHRALGVEGVVTGLEEAEVSKATLVPEDLVDNFMEFLKQVDRKAYNRLLPKMPPKSGGSEATSHFLHEVLFDEMDRLSPPGHCFGLHPGNGSLFGYWRRSEY